MPASVPFQAIKEQLTGRPYIPSPVMHGPNMGVSPDFFRLNKDGRGSWEEMQQRWAANPGMDLSTFLQHYFKNRQDEGIGWNMGGAIGPYAPRRPIGNDPRILVDGRDRFNNPTDPYYMGPRHG